MTGEESAAQVALRANRLGGAVTAGTTWNFQVLYRDPAGPGGNGFNTTDAVSIAFE